MKTKAQVSGIKNKLKRAEVYAKVKKDKKAAKREASKRKERETQELGDAAPPKQVKSSQLVLMPLSYHAARSHLSSMHGFYVLCTITLSTYRCPRH